MSGNHEWVPGTEKLKPGPGLGRVQLLQIGRIPNFFSEMLKRVVKMAANQLLTQHFWN